MSLSEKLKQAHFSKGAFGYGVKEVDAFLNELRVAAESDESALRTLRAKLDAFEGKSAEIARTENEAYRLLSAAKDEAEKIRAAAKARADVLVREAETRAAAAEAAASERASLLEREATRRANEQIGNAKQNAAMILAAADKRGRETLAAVERQARETAEKAAALSRESRDFEEKLRVLTANTVRALAALNGTAPAAASAPAAVATPASATAPTATPVSATPPTGASAIEISPEVAVPRPRRTDRPRPASPSHAEETAEEVGASDAALSEDDTPRDYSFAGGKLVTKNGENASAAPRKLYDTVSVTYDDADTDGYDGIKRLMENAGGRKVSNPTDFAN